MGCSTSGLPKGVPLLDVFVMNPAAPGAATAKETVMQTVRSIARATVLALGLAASLGHAQSLSTQGGKSMDLPSRFDPVWWGDAATYTSGFDLDSVLRNARLVLDGPATLSFTVVGTEAADRPGWGWGWGHWSHWGHHHPAKGRHDTARDAQRLPFTLGQSLSFEQASAGRVDLSVLDDLVGARWGHLRPHALVLSEDASSALLFFNIGRDKGRPDFDDLIVRVSVSPVPEPETALLWLAGLAGLGGWLRHRRGKAVAAG